MTDPEPTERYWAIALDIPSFHQGVFIDTLGGGELTQIGEDVCLRHPDLQQFQISWDALKHAERLIDLVQETLLIAGDDPIQARTTGQVYQPQGDGRIRFTSIIDLTRVQLIGPREASPIVQARSLSARLAALKARNDNFREAVETFRSKGTDGAALRQILDLVRFQEGLRSAKSERLAEEIEARFGVPRDTFLDFKDMADNRWVHPRNRLGRGGMTIWDARKVVGQILAAWLDRDEPA